MEIQGLSLVPVDPINSAAIAASCKPYNNDEPEGHKKENEGKIAAGAAGSAASGWWARWTACRGRGDDADDTVDVLAAEKEAAPAVAAPDGGEEPPTTKKVPGLPLFGGIFGAMGGGGGGSAPNSYRKQQVPTPRLYEADAGEPAGEEEYQRVPSGMKPPVVTPRKQKKSKNTKPLAEGGDAAAGDEGHRERVFSRVGGDGALLPGMAEAAAAAAEAEEGRRGTPPRPPGGQDSRASTPRTCSPLAVLYSGNRSGGTAGASRKIFPM